jgi:hypothetical protein
MSVYLGHTDEALVRLANRRGKGKLKVVKWWKIFLIVSELGLKSDEEWWRIFKYVR